jgi:hypothetical protein
MNLTTTCSKKYLLFLIILTFIINSFYAECFVAGNEDGEEDRLKGNFFQNDDQNVAKKVDAEESQDVIYKLSSGSYKPIEIEIHHHKLHQILNIPYARISSAFEPAEEYTNRNHDADDSIKHNKQHSDLCLQPIVYANHFYSNFKLPHELIT